MNKEPLVSVLMTAYNREKYIGQAIESVLNSTYTNLELIIVDDLSQDCTIEIAKKYSTLDSRVKVFVNDTNLGDYNNRNKAAGYAVGKYIVYVDSDDAIYSHGLAVMVNALERFPNAGFGLGSYPDESSPLPLLLEPKEIYIESFYKINHFDRAPGSGMIKLEAFNRVGGFSGKRMIGDYELWLKLSRYYSMVKFPAHLAWNRIHAEQESQSSYAKKNYSVLRKTVLEDNLSHTDCPLTPEEIKDIRSILFKRNIKDRILKFFFGIRRAMKH